MRRSAPPAHPGLATLATLFISLGSPLAHAQSGAERAGTVTLSSFEEATVSAQAEAQGQGHTLAPASDDGVATKRRARALRAGSTYFGPVGGIYVVDAGSGATRSFRLQAMTDFFIKEDYLYDDDKNRYMGGVLALGVTPIEYLELSAAINTRSNSNSRTDPEVLQAVFDAHFDVKGYYEPTPGLTFGADAMLSLRNGLDKVGIDASGTSVTLRGNLAFDLRTLADDVPLQLRLNGGYYFDSSSEMIEKTESARFESLVDAGISSATSEADEFRHRVRRDERLALGINRVDRAIIALGLEVPLEVTERFAIHPIAEWELGIPVNRQDYDCPYVRDREGKRLAGIDSCLANEGADVWPQRVVLGARFYPVLPGLNMLAAVEIGMGATTQFVQELAPQAPYKVLLALGYTPDLKPKPPVVREVEKRVEVLVAPVLGQVRGTVVQKGVGTGVADAKISFWGRELNPILASADGRFVSYAFPPGRVDMAIEAPGYEAGTCATAIPDQGGDVRVTCELVALPQVGTLSGLVLGAGDTPIPNVSIALTGPDAGTVSTDATGRFRKENLPAGAYTLRIEQEGFLISITPAVVKAREETSSTIALVPAPKQASVQVRKDRIQVRGTIFFATDTADLEARSDPLLAEIADVLIRNPEVMRIEVQGHTDTTGTPEHNLDLSQRRAEAVKEWLSHAGVESDRLVARGYGAEKPLSPNVTPQGRARNRRVEFVIVERAEQ